MVLHEVLFHSLRRAVPLVPYTFVFERWRVCEPPAPDQAGALFWLAALLLVDLAYYWGHRFSHFCNLAWSGHVVHHSSEFYNLTTALRQGTLGRFARGADLCRVVSET